MERGGESTSVLMLPWLAHGHMSPFLELAKKLITKRNFYVYFCSTPVNLSSIRDQILERCSVSIQLVELHLPSLPDLPPYYHTTKGLPPHLMPTLKRAFEMASPSFHEILKTLKPDLLIYDFLQPWAPKLASSLDIPAVEFLCNSTSTTSFLKNLYRNPAGARFPFPEIYLREYETSGLDSMLESSVDGVTDGERVEECFERSSDIVLVKTFREIEGKYIDYLSDITNKKIVPVGPLVEEHLINEEERKGSIIEWLDKKEQKSTLFVSFGTEFFLSKEDMQEIAYGLELSKLNFVWVVRFPMGEQISVQDAMPEGFLQRVGERGMVVEGWAPQARILGHPSTGGFVSHCGWSSVMESMKNGVPIVAMPMHLDQPFNARLVEDVGVGAEAKRDRNGSLHREEVAKVIREVVVERQGERLRRKAKELCHNMINNGDQEIDAAVKELVQLCIKRKL